MAQAAPNWWNYYDQNWLNNFDGMGGGGGGSGFPTYSVTTTDYTNPAPIDWTWMFGPYGPMNPGYGTNPNYGLPGGGGGAPPPPNPPAEPALPLPPELQQPPDSPPWEEPQPAPPLSVDWQPYPGWEAGSNPELWQILAGAGIGGGGAAAGSIIGADPGQTTTWNPGEPPPEPTPSPEPGSGVSQDWTPYPGDISSIPYDPAAPVFSTTVTAPPELTPSPAPEPPPTGVSQDWSPYPTSPSETGVTWDPTPAPTPVPIGPEYFPWLPQAPTPIPPVLGGGGTPSTPETPGKTPVPSLPSLALAAGGSGAPGPGLMAPVVGDPNPKASLFGPRPVPQAPQNFSDILASFLMGGNYGR